MPLGGSHRPPALMWQQTEDWLPRQLEIKGWSPYGQYQTCGLTAQEIKDEVRRIKDLLEVHVQNQFDWSACEVEQGHVDKKTMTNLSVEGREIRVGIELSPTRRAQARFTNKELHRNRSTASG